MHEMDVTRYEVWKFRRCIETHMRYGPCSVRGIKTCEGCKFNISMNKFNYLLQ